MDDRKIRSESTQYRVLFVEKFLFEENVPHSFEKAAEQKFFYKNYAIFE
jgi:hypothetical protein